MERRYDKVLYLLKEMTEDIYALKELFAAENDEELTKEEQDNLQLAFLKFVAATTMFKEVQNGEQIT